MNNELTMSVKKMAESIGVGIVTAYQLANSEDFYPSFRIGRKILINREKLQEWLNEKTPNERK